MADRCEHRRGRFPVTPGMTKTIKPGMTGDLTPRMTVFVMAGSDRPSHNQSFPKGETFRDTEGGCDVLGLLLNGKARLGAGAARTDEEVRPANRKIPGQAGNDEGRWRAESGGDGAGEDFSLVVATGAEAGPVEWDGDDQVNVGKMRGGSQVAAEEDAKVTPGGQVGLVFQCTGNRPVGPFVVQ